ncbi:MAG: hypothetical protein PF508_21220, partial [Spirochaeta sp.]|nr:hypothetical protein [Spirochaeta sp.]
MIHRSTSIRTRIFFSYVVLIAIIGVFIGLAGIARTVRVGIEEDRAAVLELRTSWGATRTLLGEMIINWNNGEAYGEFRAQRARFAEQLATLDEGIGSNRLYRDHFSELLDGLSAVWATADSHLDRVTAIVDDPGFAMIETMVARQPGLQRLNHLWAELVDDPAVASRRSAYLIQRLITEIEFFPIYGDTLERLLAELALQSELLQQEIVRAESIGRVVFFVTFLA